MDGTYWHRHSLNSLRRIPAELSEEVRFAIARLAVTALIYLGTQ